MNIAGAIEENVGRTDVLGCRINCGFVHHVENPGPDSRLAFKFGQRFRIHVGRPDGGALARKRFGCGAAYALT